LHFALGCIRSFSLCLTSPIYPRPTCNGLDSIWDFSTLTIPTKTLAIKSHLFLQFEDHPSHMPLKTTEILSLNKSTWWSPHYIFLGHGPCIFGRDSCLEPFFTFSTSPWRLDIDASFELKSFWNFSTDMTFYSLRLFIISKIESLFFMGITHPSNLSMVLSKSFTWMSNLFCKSLFLSSKYWIVSSTIHSPLEWTNDILTIPRVSL